MNPDVAGHLRSLSEAQFIISEINKLSIEKQKAEMRTQYGLHEKHNPLLSLSVDLYQSIPVETLHTVLLGPHTYLLKELMVSLTSYQKQQIQARVNAYDQTGLPFKLRGNICR